MNDGEFFERWKARREDTLARFGVEVPVVDYGAPELRDRLGCDEDALAKFVVEHFLGELNAFEVIVTAVTAGRIEVLFAGMTKDLKRRFREYTLIVTLGEDRQHYAFGIESKTMTYDRDDRVVVNTPRWKHR